MRGPLITNQGRLPVRSNLKTNNLVEEILGLSKRIVALKRQACLSWQWLFGLIYIATRIISASDCLRPLDICLPLMPTRIVVHTGKYIVFGHQ